MSARGSAISLTVPKMLAGVMKAGRAKAAKAHAHPSSNTVALAV